MKAVAVTMVSLLTGCHAAPDGTASTSADRDTTTYLIEALWVAEGAFQERVPIVGGFLGDRSAFEAIIEYSERGREFAEEVVSRLVDCMDRLTPAAATWEGSNLSEGMVCYAALRTIAYYEAVDESGSLTGAWPGYVFIDATADEMSAAKEAWIEVVENRWYVLS